MDYFVDNQNLRGGTASTDMYNTSYRGATYEISVESYTVANHMHSNDEKDRPVSALAYHRSGTHLDPVDTYENAQNEEIMGFKTLPG